jgi:WGR domain
MPPTRVCVGCSVCRFAITGWVTLIPDPFRCRTCVMLLLLLAATLSSVTGCDIVDRFGRNGTARQTETKTFPDFAATNKHALKNIEKKIKKGCVEVD